MNKKEEARFNELKEKTERTPREQDVLNALQALHDRVAELEGREKFPTNNPAEDEATQKAVDAAREAYLKAEKDLK